MFFKVFLFFFGFLKTKTSKVQMFVLWFLGINFRYKFCVHTIRLLFLYCTVNPLWYLFADTNPSDNLLKKLYIIQSCTIDNFHNDIVKLRILIYVLRMYSNDIEFQISAAQPNQSFNLNVYRVLKN